MTSHEKKQNLKQQLLQTLKGQLGVVDKHASTQFKHQCSSDDMKKQKIKNYNRIL